jgi:hypothetical protein
VEKMHAAAAEFDVDAYFARRIVSNHTVTMYTHLLSHYATNGPVVNQQIIAFFERLCQFTLSYGSNDPKSKENEDWAMDNPLAAQTVTLEPMLYTASFLLVLHTILQDRTLRNSPEARCVVDFATQRVQSFARAARDNPVLYVEALFSHPFPHRFCDLIANQYVTEDLRMFVERDLLLQQQYQLEQQQADAAWSSDSSDDELEFTDAPVSTRLATTKTRSQPSSRRSQRNDEKVEEGSDNELESSDELEFNDAPAESTANPTRQSKPEDDSDKELESSDELEFNDAPAEPTATPPSPSTQSPRRDKNVEDRDKEMESSDEFNDKPAKLIRAEDNDKSKENEDVLSSEMALSPSRSPRLDSVDASAEGDGALEIQDAAATLPSPIRQNASLRPDLEGSDDDDDDVGVPVLKKARTAAFCLHLVDSDEDENFSAGITKRHRHG